jgi:carboxymethylenebutenolidase
VYVIQMRLRLLMLCASLGAASPAFAQSPAAGVPPTGSGPTWAEMQKSQSWAARNLEKSSSHQEWVTTSNAGRTLKAWLVYPGTKDKLPGVLVLHEVFGLTDSTRNTAAQIAAMGYLVITPDMLSGLGPEAGNTDSFPSSRIASQTLTGLQDEVVNAELNAWADYGSKLPRSSGKFAVVGLSWGGGAAFRYAAAHPKNLKAVFVFYDVGPPTITQGPTRATATGSFPVGAINVPVYGFYPSKDSRVMASLQATKNAMAAAGKAYDPVIYEGAEHAYMRIGSDPADTNPANAAAVEQSLARLQTLLKQVLK